LEGFVGFDLVGKIYKSQLISVLLVLLYPVTSFGRSRSPFFSLHFHLIIVSNSIEWLN